MECLCTNKACLSVFIIFFGVGFFIEFSSEKYTNVVVLTMCGTCTIRVSLVRKLVSAVFLRRANWVRSVSLYVCLCARVCIYVIQVYAAFKQ